MPPSPTAALRALWFGPHTIPLSQTFLLTPLTYGLVNLKPIRPGHVLLATRLPHPRFSDLSPDEVADLFLQAQRVSRAITRHFGAQSLTLCIQDGKEAGQTVPHVHLHVIPRNEGDFPDNDDVYEKLEHTHRIDNEERTPRTPQDMAGEAEMLRKEIGEWNTDTDC
ncbi:hypothetical protein LPJ66_002372 [Kickxella alabastrina]|uniref:Uncharacterized protein n=1 Tax=Kickxella alabastrina TaxID=61397 RepID=A0ACC1IQP4_9FUNG|nr:hypothetical protein LPJ66_002372 [Kickxella alabastrina]